MTENSTPKWHHPSEVMKLHKLKQKKNALQARIKGSPTSKCSISTKETENNSSAFEALFSAKKRNNPFVKNNQTKKAKTEPILEESSDQTLFKLLNETVSSSLSNNSLTSFKNVLTREVEKTEDVQIVKAKGEKWLPIDWTLKSKMRLLSSKPFPWNQKLKISEEASGITAFTRCLDNNSETTLDISPNAKFYQCCLFWQQPTLPWLTLFPRNNQKSSSSPTNNIINSTVKDNLQQSWSDSFRSLFQLIRTGQCPYFYACANNFTILFRAAGICGFSDIHVLITPTTRGFRQLLKEEEIEFTMPLKTQVEHEEDLDLKDVKEEIEQEETDEDWLKSFGVNNEDIKQINSTQIKKTLQAECEVDNSEQSLVLIEGIEVHSLYNLLINCKSIIALTGPLAGVPPTLLAPVAFLGASLNSLKIRESKVHIENTNYYSLELAGPILPTMIHNLFALNSPDQCLTATFRNLKSTEPFSQPRSSERKSDVSNKSCMVFRKENLSDCGLLPRVLKHFCSSDKNYVASVECLKYLNDNKTFTWT